MTDFLTSTSLNPSQLPHDDLAALNQDGNDKIDGLLDHYDGFPQLVSDQNLTDKITIEMMKLLSRQPLGTVFPNLAVLWKIYLFSLQCR